MNEENFKQLCDKALLLINGVSEEVFLYEDEKAFVGAWGDCDVAYDDNTVGGVCGQPSGGGIGGGAVVVLIMIGLMAKKK